jgi:hypothetical protein
LQWRSNRCLETTPPPRPMWFVLFLPSAPLLTLPLLTPSSLLPSHSLAISLRFLLPLTPQARLEGALRESTSRTTQLVAAVDAATAAAHRDATAAATAEARCQRLQSDIAQREVGVFPVND